MLLKAEIDSKTLGSKKLFEQLDISIEQGEQIAIIGRNGVGKTTLLRMLAQEDDDFDGSVSTSRGTTVVMTAQEHADAHSQDCLSYILSALPSYTKLHTIIETYPGHMGSDISKINKYSEAIEQFDHLGYYTIEQKVINALQHYQIPEASARGPLSALSGGQKRFVELVKVQESNASLALIDEPTNHMDYIAKDAFIDWMKAAKSTLVIVTHDRDVLNEADRIIEIKDKKAFSYRGNYKAYLKMNSANTVAGMSQYEVAQQTITNLKKQIAYARSKKASWGGTADKKNPFVVMEERAKKQLRELEKIAKPSFWIDQNSATELNHKMTERYSKYKDTNIKLVGMDAQHRRQELLKVTGLSLGYGQPLFSDVSFSVSAGDRVRLHGRNGAGKTTLLKYILAKSQEASAGSNCFDGEIEINTKTRFGVYEQEIDQKYFKVTLAEAIEQVYNEKGQKIADQKIRQLLSSYLFDASIDYRQLVGSLSGGQKARFQIISMLASEPNLLILDEPTNHLDLPSIEELELALQNYTGAIIYISHDSYFVSKLAGAEIKIAPSQVIADAN
ncbi:MAG: Uup, transporter ATPase, ATP-binding cassette, subfamily er 3 [Candidatus Saccharibacteria bacterium]|nr:Uup, transporter ATPase, ATP-binding cassette, subfamily er 3 [Candidatus Saccharibacteria bacterium]